jgi:hypothetical protein
MEATPDDRVLSHPSSRAPDRTHVFSVSSMTDAGPSIPSRRPVSSSSSEMCSFSFSKSSPIDLSSSLKSVLDVASLRIDPIAAARPGISAAGIGVGSGTGYGLFLRILGLGPNGRGQGGHHEHGRQHHAPQD